MYYVKGRVSSGHIATRPNVDRATGLRAIAQPLIPTEWPTEWDVQTRQTQPAQPWQIWC